MTRRDQLTIRLLLVAPVAFSLLSGCGSNPSEATTAARSSVKSSCAALQQLTDQLARPRPSDLADDYYRTVEQDLQTATNLAAKAAEQDKGYQEFADTLYKAAQTYSRLFTLDKVEPLIQDARKKHC